MPYIILTLSPQGGKDSNNNYNQFSLLIDKNIDTSDVDNIFININGIESKILFARQTYITHKRLKCTEINDWVFFNKYNVYNIKNPRKFIFEFKIKRVKNQANHHYKLYQPQGL